VSQKEEIPFRRKKRYNHVTINLMIHVKGQWRRIRAADWNEIGFNFILDQELTEEFPLFKKGAMEFNGQIVWSHQRVEESAQMEMILNNLIIGRLNQLARDKEMAKRIIRLIRSPGLIDQKKGLLRLADGLPQNDEELEDLCRKERLDHHFFRYGVKIDSSEWVEIVKQTLEASDVLLKLGKLGEGLSNLSE
jgi:hypothetical protein